MKQEKKDQRRAWPTGELTEEVIKKDLQTSLIPSAIAFTVAAVLFFVVLTPILMKATDVTLRLLALAAGAVICTVSAYRRWRLVFSKRRYRITEDRIVSKRIDTDTQKKDARQSDLSTRIPVLELEKHGLYKIDAEQIHDYYIPLQLVHDFQEDEVLYMVYDDKTGKLLRIYRAKYWTLPEETP